MSEHKSIVQRAFVFATQCTISLCGVDATSATLCNKFIPKRNKMKKENNKHTQQLRTSMRRKKNVRQQQMSL